tara:strand:- start:648 stop:821 length:174 start_codon:yes stop_codon:yes gene_type:complete
LSDVARDFINDQIKRRVSASKTLRAMGINLKNATWLDVELEILNFYEKKETNLQERW